MQTHFQIRNVKFDVFSNGVDDERKVFVPMSPEFFTEECRWLTIGIGGRAGAEQFMREKYPNCEVYGVDATNPGNFSKIGNVLQSKVGIDDENEQIIGDKKVKIISFLRVLDEFVHSRLIHYLSIDIESYEMVILRELIGNGKFVNENITFCQIDVELHDPKSEGQHPATVDINRVQWMLDFIAEPSPYMPIFTVSYIRHHKVTFVNVKNSECEKAFKIRSYFNKPGEIEA
uniref:Methyltransferase FkbM domain-containing protein n=1 Tax=Panagrolaimus sp. ES5 TaxID=591445 RepID=A0AC34GPD1_9BILA